MDDRSRVRLVLFRAMPRDGLEERLREILEVEFSDRLEIEEIGVNAVSVELAVAQFREGLPGCPPQAALVLGRADDPVLREMICRIRHRSASLPILVVLPEATPDQVCEILKAGATDYGVAPLRPEEILPRLHSRLGDGNRSGPSEGMERPSCRIDGLLGQHPCFLSELEKVPVASESSAPVLIQGETGTGKELFASAIHHSGRWAGGPFVPLNCGAVPADLLENELFGHQSGAYTGAARSTKGLIHEADGGTLFLDEINSTPAGSQVKLLRFLEEQEYRRLGSNKIVHANVRIIAASNCDLRRAITEGQMRADLFYRLNVIEFTVPSLRQRRSDIVPLGLHFLRRAASREKKLITGIAPRALERLRAYSWPGNVRELRNVVDRAVVFARGEVLTGEDLHLPDRKADGDDRSFHELKAVCMAEFEKEFVRELLVKADGNVSHAAVLGSLDRKTLWRLKRKHGIPGACGASC